MTSVTCIAPVNIAVIKYWGKRDETLILPLNDSLSVTLSTEQLCSKTTITADKSFDENTITLNGKVESFANERLQRCLSEIRKLAKNSKNSRKDIVDWNIRVVSVNNFPTAAGLASSASGYACFVYTLACLYGLAHEEISHIARMGSGSACRSIFGGFVQWQKGEECDGSDSIAVQVAPTAHWPDLRILILVVNDSKKTTSSTGGMSRSVKTSELLKHRVAHCVPERLTSIVKAIKDHNFPEFAKITMQDSNQFHAVCQDTYPPCFYMNDVSKMIINMVHDYNEIHGSIKLAYTFDAGPNACLLLLERDVTDVLATINHLFPNDNQLSIDYVKGLPVEVDDLKKQPEKPLTVKNSENNLLKYIIYTQIGDGPKEIKE
jgi:diphosphomevalonate decarboxylase